MLVLVSGATTYQRGDHVGDLVVPKQWNDPDELTLVPNRWAMDNGCFKGLDPGAFMRMLYAFRKRIGCLFCSVPDAVGDAAETRYLWKFWSPIVRACDRVPAFVAQDGLSPHQVPWNEIGALFLGGTDEYKESPAARSLCGYAKARGLWVHWGRVNGQRRYKKALDAGADSIDGTGFSMAPHTNIPLPKQWHAQIRKQPELDLGTAQ